MSKIEMLRFRLHVTAPYGQHSWFQFVLFMALGTTYLHVCFLQSMQFSMLSLLVHLDCDHHHMDV